MTERKNSRAWLGFLIRFLSFSFVLGATGIFVILTVPSYVETLFGTGRDVEVNKPCEAECIVIDPGHGGEDGGAGADDGTLEKELNLEIASLLADLCRVSGHSVVMTRTTDTQIYDLYHELDDYSGHKKVYDLRNRLRLTKESGGTLFVSLHMNKFPATSCTGTQVYYSPNDARSRDLAGTIQAYARQYLQPENDRVIKEAGSSIFLLKQIDIPAVMVECGFLSSENDLSSLKDPAYRRDFALTVFCAIAEYMTSPGNKA